MEEWLFKKDEYVPADDKDVFINKSIMSFFRTLSLIKRSSSISNKNIYNINPAVKLLFSFLSIVFISLGKSYLYILIIIVYYLVLLSLLEVKEIKKILSISIIVPVFTLVMLIPSIISGNIGNSFLLVLKVAGSVMNINILAYSTRWNEMTKALKIFFVPDLFILVFDITIKYIYILGEYSMEMLYALKLKSIGKNNNKYSSLSQIMGNLFLKSKEMGDEMYSAMECRGFTGEYVSHVKFQFGFKEFVYCSINMFILLLYFFIRA